MEASYLLLIQVSQWGCFFPRVPVRIKHGRYELHHPLSGSIRMPARPTFPLEGTSYIQALSACLVIAEHLTLNQSIARLASRL